MILGVQILKHFSGLSLVCTDTLPAFLTFSERETTFVTIFASRGDKTLKRCSYKSLL